MANGINKAIVIGHLGQEPELRYLNSGSAVTTIKVATNESWRDKDTDELQQRTEWHRVVLFNRLAEIACDYLHKGSQLYIEGRLRTRQWQDSEGIERYVTEIIASDMQMLGNATDSTPEHSADKGQAKSKSRKKQAQPEPAIATASDEDDDLDIEF